MTAFQPGSLAYEALIAERDKLRADNERHRNDYSILKRDYDELRADNERLLGVWRDKTTLLKDAYADNERLRAALEEIEFHGGPAADCARRALEPMP